jgi:hypothetical protein
MTRASIRPSIPVLVLLVAGLLPAGDAWYRAVALPALSVQVRYAVPLFISDGAAAPRADSAQASVSGTRLQRAAAAMTLLLGTRR